MTKAQNKMTNTYTKMKTSNNNKQSIIPMLLNSGPGRPPPPPAPPNTAHVVCLPHQTHLIELMSSLEETPGPEMGVR